MIIQLTETEAVTIADFLVKSIDLINNREGKKSDEIKSFLSASDEFISQVLTECDKIQK